MRIIDLINGVIEKGAAALPGLDSFLNGIATKYPDAAPEIREYLEKANTAVPPSAEALLDELKTLLSKGLDPRSHPSDLA
jgi:hypothetical protein